MRNIITFIKSVCLSAILFTLQSCGEEGVIPRQDMAAIISEMYLIDQVVESDNALALQADTMLVYPAVIVRNGYSLAEFEKSMRYYMGEGESYSEVLKLARERLSAREKELNEIIKEMHNIPYKKELKEWWATDSVRVVDTEEFLYDKLLRSVRWMVMGDEMKLPWTILDSAIVDIPQNPQWWVNTVSPAKREYTSIIIRGKDELESEKKTIFEDEKNSSKLPVPIDRLSADKKRIPDLK